MSLIFISYSRSDKSIVDELIKQLEAAGHPVWVDREGIRGGEKWRQEIVEAIEQNDVFLLVMSNHSIQSDHVRTEVDLAKESNKRIIPIDIQHVTLPTSMKYQLVGLQRINMYSNYEDGFRELLIALGNSLEGGPSETVSTGESLGQRRPSSRRTGIWITGVIVLVVVVAALAFLFSIKPGPIANSAPPTSTQGAEQSVLHDLTTVDELEPLLQKANIRLSEPADEARTRSYFTGPDSAYHMLAVAVLTVVGDRRFSQPINLDIVDEYYTQMGGVGYDGSGPLDLDQVQEALVEAHNDYWGDSAASLDGLFEGALASLPTETHPTETPHPAPIAAPPTETSPAEAAPVVSSAPLVSHPNLDELTTYEELAPLLEQANIHLSEPEDEERTRSYFTGPDSAYHMLAVASLKVIGEHRFKQYINLDIVDKWFTQAAGSDYAGGLQDRDLVEQALIDAHNDYWGDNATSLDELLEPLN